MEPTKLLSEGHSGKLQAMLTKLRDHHTLCDLTIEVSGGIAFAVHKVVLVAHSKYFKNQLDCGNLQGNRFVISSVDSAMFAPLLHFLYTGELTISQNNIWAIITAATQLDMADAIDLCETYLNDTLKSTHNENSQLTDVSVSNQITNGDELTKCSQTATNGRKENEQHTVVPKLDTDITAVTPLKKKRGRPRKCLSSKDETGDKVSDDAASENAQNSDGNQSDWNPNYKKHSSTRKKRKQTNPRKHVSHRRGPGRPKGSSSKKNKGQKPVSVIATKRRIVKKEKKFSCVRCLKQFSFYSTYVLHQKLHGRGGTKIHRRVHDSEGIYRWFPGRLGKPEKQPMGYKCSLCQKTSKYMSQGEYHRQRKHAKPKQCDQCPFSFMSAIALFQHHIQRHGGYLHTKPSQLFRCRLCLCSYRHRNNFISHVKAVHNVGLKCESCCRYFRPAHVRNRHLAICYRMPVHKLTKKTENHGTVDQMICDNCGRLFKYQKAYDKHTRLCTETVPSEERLLRKSRTHVCKHCGEEFDNLRKMQDHCRIQHPPLTIGRKRRPYAKRSRNWDCDECSFKSTNPHHLMKHVKSSHPDLSIPCSECRHMRMRHQLALSCEMCSQTFSVPAQLRVHKYIKHKIDDGSIQVHECPIDGCKYTCVWKSSLKVHMQRHQVGKPFTCDICDKKFKREKGLEKHMNKIHKRIRPYMCDICGQSYGEDAELKAHMVRHNTDKQFKCDRCPYATHDKGNFQSHMFGMHRIVISPDMAIFTCNVCDYTTDRKHRYEMHMKNHMGIRDVTCPVCGKSFVTKNTLSNHIQRVHSEKTYTCNFCQYTTGNQHTYKEHVRVMHTHRNIKPYKCAYCDFRCHTSGNCRKHCANRHKGLEIKWVRLCELYPDGPGPECDGVYPDERPMVESNIKHLAISRRISKDVIAQQQQESQYQQSEDQLVAVQQIEKPGTLQQSQQQQQQIEKPETLQQSQQQQLQEQIYQTLTLGPESVDITPPSHGTLGVTTDLVANHMSVANHVGNSYGAQQITYSMAATTNATLPGHLTHQQGQQATLLHIPQVPMTVLHGRGTHDNGSIANLPAGIMGYDYGQPGQLNTLHHNQQQQHPQQPLPQHKHLTLL